MIALGSSRKVEHELDGGFPGEKRPERKGLSLTHAVPWLWHRRKATRSELFLARHPVERRRDEEVPMVWYPSVLDR